MELLQKIINSLCVISCIFFALFLAGNWIFDWAWVQAIPFQVKLALALPYITAVFFNS